jgi:hypothetical protein
MIGGQMPQQPKEDRERTSKVVRLESVQQIYEDPNALDALLADGTKYTLADDAVVVAGEESDTVYCEGDEDMQFEVSRDAHGEINLTQPTPDAAALPEQTPAELAASWPVHAKSAVRRLDEAAVALCSSMRGATFRPEQYEKLGMVRKEVECARLLLLGVLSEEKA